MKKINYPYKRIKNLRIDKNLKQKDIAKELNLKQKTYSNYERGVRRMPIGFLIKLADYYDTSISYLLELTDNPTFYTKRI